MKQKITQLLKSATGKLSFMLIPVLAIGLAGCTTPDYTGVMAGPQHDNSGGVAAARLNVGDSVTVSLSGPPELPPDQTEEIKDDGTITLPDIGAVQAAGKTLGELQTAIYNRYVPALYTHLNVSIKIGDRVFYVRGEVKAPGRQIYVGEITVTKAITSAGDFTDFANTRNVWLTRADGRRFKLNCDKILTGEAPDPGVYPGDQIEVERRLY